MYLAKENVTVMAYALTHAGENNDHVEVTALQTLDQPIIAKRFSKGNEFNSLHLNLSNSSID